MAPNLRIPVLIDLLASEDEGLLLDVVHTLGELRAEAAIPALVARLGDVGWPVQRAIVDALQQISDTPLVALLQQLGYTADSVPVMIVLDILTAHNLPAPAKTGSTMTHTEPGRSASHSQNTQPVYRGDAESPPPPPAPDTTVQCSAYYPREARPAEWQPLYAYMFRPAAAATVGQDAARQIETLAAFRRLDQAGSVNIPEGTLITATPCLPGFQFNPPSQTLAFFEDWQRFTFQLRAQGAPLHQAANGALTFTAGGVLVAEVALSVFVTDQVVAATPQPTPSRPIYDRVFASYSRKDTAVVAQVEAAATTLGLTYLRDVISLRSGERWHEGLLRLIEQATVFQLFWSEFSAVSEHCRAEWLYAVSLDREESHFIRPVYWAQPMPAPPDELAHLHFAYQPDLVH